MTAPQQERRHWDVDPTWAGWDEGVSPTPEQVAAWLGVASQRDRATFTRQALATSEAAARCFREDHAGQARALEAVRSDPLRWPVWWTPDGLAYGPADAARAGA